MYTSPSEWTISKYSIPFEIIPGLIPSHFKGHLRDMYLQEHTWIHLHFKNCHKCQSDYFPGQSTPIWLYAFIILFPQKSSVNLDPKQNLLCINNYQPKEPLEGMLCTPPDGSGWLEPIRRPVLGSWAPRIKRVQWVGVEALPPGPFVVNLNSHRNIDHCKSVNECQTGN